MEELEETIDKPKTLDEIVLSLKILANIKYNDKLCIRNNCLAINSWAVLRYYYNDSRESTIQYLEKLFNDLLPLLIFSEYFSLNEPLLSNRKNIIN